MKKSAKILILVLCILLVISTATAGVLAWMAVKSSSVVNTFAPTTIGLKLDESKATYNATTDKFTLSTGTRVQANSDYKLVPGWELPKDPIVTVTGGSEKCYVFVTVNETNNTINGKTILEYSIDSSWSKKTISGTTVYYKVFDSSTAAQTQYVLTGNKVTVNDELTIADFTALGTKKPALTFQAYAVQYYKNGGTAFTVEEAWGNRVQ